MRPLNSLFSYGRAAKGRMKLRETARIAKWSGWQRRFMRMIPDRRKLWDPKVGAPHSAAGKSLHVISRNRGCRPKLGLGRARRTRKNPLSVQTFPVGAMNTDIP